MVDNATPTPRYMNGNATPTPVFTEPNLVGHHNANLEASTLRIMEGASWKKQETIMLLPAAKMVPTKCVLTWMHMLTPPNQPFQRYWIDSMEVGDAYSTAIEAVMAQPAFDNYKFILTLESDNTIPQDGFLQLVRHMDAHPEFAAISGLYWTKYEGGVPQIWGDAKDPLVNFRPQPPDPNGGLVECCGTGMGFVIWRLSMFRDKRLPRPLFKTKCSSTDGVGTQDLSFWTEARKFGYRCAVACDVKVGHMDVNTGIVW